MSSASQIEWTDATWNPVVGCSPVSEGCRNCYAAREAVRLAGNPNEHVGPLYAGLSEMRGTGSDRRPVFTGLVRTVPHRLSQPLRWKKPRRVFVNSVSDLFHEAVPDFFIDRVFAVMACSPQHTFQILTKRPERMAAYLTTPSRLRTVASDVNEILDELEKGQTYQRALDGTAGMHWGDNPDNASHRKWAIVRVPWPLPNVWLGTSVEDQAAADERIPHLLRTPAAVRFLSCEPLLGPVDLRQRWKDYLEGWETEAVCCGQTDPAGYCCGHPDPAQVQTERVDWVIAGGESGPGARPCRVEWIRGLVSQARSAGVAVFVKQLGARPIQTNLELALQGTAFECEHGYDVCPTCDAGDHEIELRDRKGGDPEEWPEDLRVREFPDTAGATA